MASRCLLNGSLAIVLTMSLLVHNATGTSASRRDDEGGDSGGRSGAIVGGEGATPSPSLIDRVTGVMDNVKQQASETLGGAGYAAGKAEFMLRRLQPGTTKQTSEVDGNGLRATEKKLPSGENTLGRLQETKGRTVAAAKKVVDETIHNLQSTVSDIQRTISDDDLDDISGDRRISNSLDGIFRPWAWNARRRLSRDTPIRVENRREMEVVTKRKMEVESWREEKDELYRQLMLERKKWKEMDYEWWKKMKDETLSKAMLEYKSVMFPPRREVVVPTMHPLTRNSYNNTSNSITNSDLVIIILIIITTIL